MTLQSDVQGRATAPPQAGTINWRVVVLASLGAGLEFYDFIIYGIFAQYIAATFFPRTIRWSR